MILDSLCQNCLQPFELVLEPVDVALIREISDKSGAFCPCPRLCGGKINVVPDPAIKLMANDQRLRAPMALTGQELYKAVNGLGLPDEVPRTRETIEAHLLAYRITKIDLDERNGRFYLNELQLSNGVTIHLTSGLYGCQVLKLTKKEQEHASGGDIRDPDSD